MMLYIKKVTIFSKMARVLKKGIMKKTIMVNKDIKLCQIDLCDANDIFTIINTQRTYHRIRKTVQLV